MQVDLEFQGKGGTGDLQAEAFKVGQLQAALTAPLSTATQQLTSLAS